VFNNSIIGRKDEVISAGVIDVAYQQPTGEFVFLDPMEIIQNWFQRPPID
jgi:hypothetical protein